MSSYGVIRAKAEVFFSHYQLNYFDAIREALHVIIWAQEWGATKAPFANLSVREIFGLATVRFFESHSYLTGATAAELRRHLWNMNVIFNR